MLNKKAGFEDLLPIIVVFIFLIGLWIFVPITNTSSANQKIQATEFETLDAEAEALLIRFLQQPFETNSLRDANTADAITLYVQSPDELFLGQIRIAAKTYFDQTSVVTELQSWALQINHPLNGAILEPEERTTPKGVERIPNRKEIATVQLPNILDDEELSVTLFLTTT